MTDNSPDSTNPSQSAPIVDTAQEKANYYFSRYVLPIAGAAALGVGGFLATKFASSALAFSDIPHALLTTSITAVATAGVGLNVALGGMYTVGALCDYDAYKAGNSDATDGSSSVRAGAAMAMINMSMPR